MKENNLLSVLVAHCSLLKGRAKSRGMKKEEEEEALPVSFSLPLLSLYSLSLLFSRSSFNPSFFYVVGRCGFGGGGVHCVVDMLLAPPQSITLLTLSLSLWFLCLLVLVPFWVSFFFWAKTKSTLTGTLKKMQTKLILKKA